MRISTTSPGLNFDALPAAARFQIGGGDQVTGIERAHTLLGSGVEQDTGRQDRRHFFDGRPVNPLGPETSAAGMPP